MRNETRSETFVRFITEIMEEYQEQKFGNEKDVKFLQNVLNKIEDTVVNYYK